MSADSSSIEVYAPFAGIVKPLSDSPDEVFAQGLMGAGFLLCPTNDTATDICVSPATGQVITLMAHAFVVGSPERAVLVHCGIDTVHLGDDWSQLLTKLGDNIEIGDPVAKLAWNEAAASGYRADTPVVGVDARRFEFAPTCCPGQHVAAKELIGTLSW